MIDRTMHGRAPQPPAATGLPAQRPATRWMQRLAEETPTAADSTGLAIDTTQFSVPEAVARRTLRPLWGRWRTACKSFVWLTAIMLVPIAPTSPAVPERPDRHGDLGGPNLPGVVVAHPARRRGRRTGGQSVRPPTGRTSRTVVRRLLIGAAAGAIVGIVVAMILFTFGFTTAIGVLAATVGGAALLAGLSAGLAALRSPAPWAPSSPASC